MPKKARKANLYSLPNSRVGKGVSFQPLLDASSTHRNSSRPLPDRTADQDLVPESQDEAQEGTESRQGDQRARTQKEGLGRQRGHQPQVELGRSAAAPPAPASSATAAPSTTATATTTTNATAAAASF